MCLNSIYRGPDGDQGVRIPKLACADPEFCKGGGPIIKFCLRHHILQRGEGSVPISYAGHHRVADGPMMASVVMA